MLSIGHGIVWLARYEGLIFLLRTIINNLSHVSFNAYLRLHSTVLRTGYALHMFFMEN